MTLRRIILLILFCSPFADLSQVQALIDAGHLKRARAIVEPAYRSDRNDARTLYLLSQVREGFGDLDAALPLAEQALAKDPQKADYHFEVALICGEMARKANVLRQLGLARRTEREAQAAISLNPKHADARSLLVTFYMEAPAIAGGNKQKAKKMAAELFQIDPVQGVLADLEIAQDEHDQPAIKAAYEKLQSYPQSYDAAMALAHHYVSEPMNDALAERHARNAIRIDSTRADAYGVLANLFAQRQRLAELEAALNESEKNISDDLTPFYNAGVALLQKGSDLPRAEAYFRKYLNQEPEGGAPDAATARRQLNLVLEKLRKRP